LQKFSSLFANSSIVFTEVHVIILKKFLAKKQEEGKTRQYYSCNSFFTKSMSSAMSSNSSISILTIIYIAAFDWIGVTPFIPFNLVNAKLAVSDNFYFSFVKWSSPTSFSILGRAA